MYKKNHLKLFFLSLLLVFFSYSCSFINTNIGSLSFSLPSREAQENVKQYEYIITLKDTAGNVVFEDITQDNSITIPSILAGNYILSIKGETKYYNIISQEKVRVSAGLTTNVDINFELVLKDFTVSLNAKDDVIKIAQYVSDKKLEATILNPDNLSLTYQWQKQNKDTSQFSDIEGATSLSYEIKDKTKCISDVYRIVVTDTATGRSKIATATMEITPWEITIDDRRNPANFTKGEYIIGVYNPSGEHNLNNVRFTGSNDIVIPVTEDGIITIPKATGEKQTTTITAFLGQNELCSYEYVVYDEAYTALTATASNFDELQKAFRLLNDEHKKIEITVSGTIEIGGSSGLIVGCYNDATGDFTGDYDITLINQGQKVTFKRATGYKGTLFTVGNGCKLTLTASSGQFVLDGSVEHGTSPLIKSFGELILNNCSITGNVNTTQNGKPSLLPSAIYVGDDVSGEAKPVSLTMSGTEISNHTTSKNGTVYINNTQTSPIKVSLDTCFFSGNTSELGALTFNRTDSNAKNDISITTCDFDTNWATSNGGGIYLNNANATITDTTFGGNVAEGNGGAIYASSSSVLVKGHETQAGDFTSYVGNNGSENTALRGAGIYADNSSITLDSIYLKCNKTSDNNKVDTVDKGYGGGVYLGNASSIKIINGTIISDNTTFSSGAGIYADGGCNITFTKGYITDNMIARLHPVNLNILITASPEKPSTFINGSGVSTTIEAEKTITSNITETVDVPKA